MNNNNHIIRLTDSILNFYYGSDSNIYVRKFENNKLYPPKIVLENALPNFTVTLKDGSPEVFCRDNNGNIMLVSYSNENYESQVILENQSDQIHKILFYSMNTPSSMSLIYNIPEGQKQYRLMNQNLSENSKWDKPELIDTCQYFKDNLFYVYPIGASHSIVSYVDLNNNLGYREITPTQLGSFNILANNSDSILDFSILATNDAIHFLYIVGNIFSFRLMYRKKTDDEFTKPLILWEGNRIDNCLLWVSNGSLTASFMNGNSLYVQSSNNNGDSFFQPEIYRNKFCLKPIKAKYISSLKMNQSDFFTNEIYVDSYNPWDIQILPDISNNFYPKYKPKELPTEVIQQEPAPIPVRKPEDSAPSFIAERLNVMNSENQDLRYKIAKLHESLGENTKLINNLNAKISHESKTYENQIKELKSTISVLEKINKALEANTLKNIAPVYTKPEAIKSKNIEVQKEVLENITIEETTSSSDNDTNIPLKNNDNLENISNDIDF